MQPHREAAVGLLLHQLVRAAVPDLDRAGAVVALRDLALEAPVLERMILDVDREVLLARLQRNAFRHRPRRENAVALEPEVVVQPSRVVPLHDEDRGLRLAALAPERLRRLRAISLALVLRKLLAHAPFPGFELYACRLHNEYMAGISLWTLWTASVADASEPM